MISDLLRRVGALPLWALIAAGGLASAGVGVGVGALGVESALARGRRDDPPQSPAQPPGAPTLSAALPAPAKPQEPAPPLFDDPLPIHVGKLPEGLPSLSAQGCNGCHYAAHETWRASRHAQAWTSPAFQKAVAAAGDATACLGCHLPLDVQHDQLAIGAIDGLLSRPVMEPNPRFNLGLRAEGVTCAACHVRDGTVLGTHPSADAPHPVTVSAELSSGEMCATCHQLTWPGADRPWYDTWGEWKASTWADAGVGCQDCHMAPVAGVITPGSDGMLPSHGFPADARRAVSVLIRQIGEGNHSADLQRGQPLAVEVVVQNTGAGHAFPTGNPAKGYIIEVQVLDAAGKPLAPALAVRFERLTEAAPPWKTTADTRLPAGGEREVRHTFDLNPKGAGGAGMIEVRMINTLGGAPQVLQQIPVTIR